MSASVVGIGLLPDAIRAFAEADVSCDLLAHVDELGDRRASRETVVLDGLFAGAGGVIDRLRRRGARIVAIVDAGDLMTAQRARDGGVDELLFRPLRPEEIRVRLDLRLRGSADPSVQTMIEISRRIVETAGEGIWTLDATRRTAFANARMAEMLGVTAEMLGGLSAEDLVSEHERPRFEERLDRTLAGERLSFDVALVHADGSEVWMSVNTTPIVLGADGARGILLMASDVTTRLRTESALRRSEARYRALVETAPDRIVILSGDGTIEFVSRPLDDAEHLGRSLFEFIAPDHRERAELAVSRAREQDEVVIDDLDLVGSDGGARSHVLRLRRIDDRFGPDRLVGFLTDVSELKRIEAALQASRARLSQAQRMEAVGRLAGGLAHDLNNILSVVTGCASFIASGLRAADPLQGDIRRILEAAGRAEALARQLLAFSRRQVLRPSAVDLGEVVRTLERLLGRVLGEHVLLRVRTGAKVPSVFVDVGQIEQVVLNLATHARDSMPSGGALSIETAERTLDEAVARREGIAPGRYAALVVRDTGPGLDGDALAHVFEPFYRSDTGSDTGLLLASVYGIVRQSGGAVLVDSVKGKGTVFTVLLPAFDDGNERLSSRPAPRGGATILVVEDDAQVREVIRRALESAGYHTLEAAGPAEALDRVEQHDGAIDMLLTDVVMPGMSGVQLARCIEPLQPKMRVLFVTGYLDDTTLRLGLPTNGAAVVPKPFTPLALVRRVAEVLEGRDAR